MDSKGKGYGNGMVVAIVMIAVVVSVGTVVFGMQQGWWGAATGGDLDTEGADGDFSGQIRFNLNQAIKESQEDFDSSNTSIGIYDGNNELESVDLDNNGFGTTGSPYQVGDTYTLKVEAHLSDSDKCVTRWINDWTIPAQKATIDGDEVIAPDPIEVPEAPSLSVSVDGPNGTISDSGTYSKSTSSNPSFTIEVSNGKDDSGWVSSYDPTESLDYEVVVYVKLYEADGTNTEYDSVVLTNNDLEGAFSKSDSRWYYSNVSNGGGIEDHPLTRIVTSDGVEQAGDKEFQITMDLSGTDLSSDNIGVKYGTKTYFSSSRFSTYTNLTSPISDSSETSQTFVIGQ